MPANKVVYSTIFFSFVVVLAVVIDIGVVVEINNYLECRCVVAVKVHVLFIVLYIKSSSHYLYNQCTVCKSLITTESGHVTDCFR